MYSKSRKSSPHKTKERGASVNFLMKYGDITVFMTPKLLKVRRDVDRSNNRVSTARKQKASLGKKSINQVYKVHQPVEFVQQFPSNYSTLSKKLSIKKTSTKKNVSNVLEEEIRQHRVSLQKQSPMNNMKSKMLIEPTTPDNIHRGQGCLTKFNTIILHFNGSCIANIRDEATKMIQINFEVCTWVKSLFNQIKDFTFERYLKCTYTEDEMRLVFCESLILNYLKFTSWFRQRNQGFWNRNKFQILQNMKTHSKMILDYLMTSLHKNETNFQSLLFQKELEIVNNSQDPRYDILKNTGIKFERNEGQDVHYVKQIKLFFNQLITKSDKEFQSFEKNMTQIFKGVQKDESKLKFVIGRKLKENFPLFTDEELSTLNFECKSPQILRILIKWLEEMDQLLEDTDNYVSNKKVFKSHKNQMNQPEPATDLIRKLISNKIMNANETYQQQAVKLKNTLTYLLDGVGRLVSSTPQQSHYMKADDFKTVKFSRLISQSLPSLTVSRIQMIVEICRELQSPVLYNLNTKQNLGEQKLPQMRDLSRFDLLTFSVFDLLRCKCVGSGKTIKAVYESIKKQPYLEIIRVKNRLNYITNDILINCKIKNSPITCEIQMQIIKVQNNQQSTKAKKFTHFLYELERSKYGPLCEACLIINNTDPRMQYINKLKDVKMNLNSLTEEQRQNWQHSVAKDKCHNGHPLKYLKSSLPFVCSICSTFNKEYSSYFDSAQCKDCNLLACPRCLMDRLDKPERLSQYYLKGQQFKNEKECFIRKICQLKNYNQIKKFGERIKKILIDNNCEQCMVISYAQSAIMRKGYKLGPDNKVIPTFFTMIRRWETLDSDGKYDIVVLFNKEHIKLMTLDSIREINKIQLANSSICQSDIFQFVNKTSESKRLRCIITNGAILILDLDETVQNIQKVVKELRVQKAIQECIKFKNTTLNINSIGLKDLSILGKESSRLSHVFTVEADQNEIQKLDEFWKLKNLRKVSLKKNSLKDYDAITIENQHFVDLFLGYNKFIQFPLIKAPQLTRIVLKSNKIKYISNLGKSIMPKLTELGLADNKIPSLPLIDLPQLRSLNLSKNKIQDLSTLNQSKIKKIQKIKLDNNFLKKIPILDFPELKQLSISFNQILSIDNLKDSNIKLLSTLNLQHNEISEMPELKLPNLKILDLSENQLTSLKNISQTQFQLLVQLKLNNNSIEKLPRLAFKQLEQLNLGTNKIDWPCEQGNPCFAKSVLPMLSCLYLAEKEKAQMKPDVLASITKSFKIVFNKNEEEKQGKEE